MLHFILRYFIIAVAISFIVWIVAYRYHKAKDKIEEDWVVWLILDTLSRFWSLGICLLIVRFAIKAILE